MHLIPSSFSCRKLRAGENALRVITVFAVFLDRAKVSRLFSIKIKSLEPLDWQRPLLFDVMRYDDILS
jgi:hypothetical protein